ncbi:MAG TPA: CsiV family protein [Xanthomonadales bacterium]
MKRLLPLLLLFVSSAVLAESGFYRVEVIVFRHLTTTPEPLDAPELRSFSQFPDLEGSGHSKDPDPPAEPAALEAGVLPSGLNDVLQSNLPDDMRVVTGRGNEMDDVWRRLRSSQSYEPLMYAAWEQNRVDYYPPMRIHDQQVIDTQLRPPTSIMVADLTAQDPLAAYRSTFYRLDGSVQLRRSRFLHLFLDLEFRENRPQNAAGTGFQVDNVMQTASGDNTGGAGNYGLYALVQNRQVSTGQMQYFDTPFFGALVYVTSLP